MKIATMTVFPNNFLKPYSISPDQRLWGIYEQ